MTPLKKIKKIKLKVNSFDVKIRIFEKKDLKDLKLFDLVEERKILKNKDEIWLLYFGFFVGDDFCLTENIIRIMFSKQIKNNIKVIK